MAPTNIRRKNVCQQEKTCSVFLKQQTEYPLPLLSLPIEREQHIFILNILHCVQMYVCCGRNEKKKSNAHATRTSNQVKNSAQFTPFVPTRKCDGAAIVLPNFLETKFDRILKLSKSVEKFVNFIHSLTPSPYRSTSQSPSPHLSPAQSAEHCARCHFES